jgi:hypothetical protein
MQGDKIWYWAPLQQKATMPGRVRKLYRGWIGPFIIEKKVSDILYTISPHPEFGVATATLTNLLVTLDRITHYVEKDIIPEIMPVEPIVLGEFIDDIDPMLEEATPDSFLTIPDCNLNIRVADETLEDILNARQNEERREVGSEENGELEQEVLAQPVVPQAVEDELEEEIESSDTVDEEEGAVGNEVEGVELEWDSEHEVVEDVEDDVVEEVDGAGAGPSVEGNVLPVAPVDVIIAKKRKAVEPPKQAMKEKEGKYWFRGTKHSRQWYADDQDSPRRKQARPRSPTAPAISDDSDF